MACIALSKRVSYVSVAIFLEADMSLCKTWKMPESRENCKKIPFLNGSNIRQFLLYCYKSMDIDTSRFHITDWICFLSVTTYILNIFRIKRYFICFLDIFMLKKSIQKFLLNMIFERAENYFFWDATWSGPISLGGSKLFLSHIL